MENFNKGDILKGKKTKHPIIFIRSINQDEFIGCFITHSTTNDYPNNIGFAPSHFFEKDINHKVFKVQYDKSYFVRLELIKKFEWGPFSKKGQLTPEGIEFVENYLQNESPTYWN